MKENAFKLIQTVGISGLKCESTGNNTLHFEVAKMAAIAAVEYLQIQLGLVTELDGILEELKNANTSISVTHSPFHELQEAKKALQDIVDWDDEKEMEWDDQGKRAKDALNKIFF